MSNTKSFARPTGKLARRMTDLIGSPVTTVARVNVIWLDTFRGMSVIVTMGALVHQRLFGDSPPVVWLTLASTAGLLAIAWFGLRNLGGPLRLGLSGGVAAVSGPTLYIADTNWLTSRPMKILGRWPVDAITLERVNRFGVRRLLTVKFPNSGSPAHLEVVGRRKDETIVALFGSVPYHA